MDHLRALLYYPLGVLPGFFFGSRVLLQMVQSEKRGYSYSSPLFWVFSLCGNGLLALHYCVQIQFPFALLQALNGTIAIRNLDLHTSHPRLSRAKTLLLGVALSLLVTSVFVYQSYHFLGHFDWIRSPRSNLHHAPWIHLLGTLGGGLFASRFWYQWWRAESTKKSTLTKGFWTISLLGGTLSTLYFFLIGDPVSTAYSSLGLIPYLRNLSLIKNISPR